MQLRSMVSRRAILSVSVVLSTLLSTLDSTIVNVALPHMQGSLQANQDQVAWVLTSYIVITAITMPLTGWFGTRFGLRRVLSISVVGFTLGSIGCGFAANLGQMVFFRIFQGALGASLVPLSQVALMQEYPRSEHPKVMAMWTMGVLVGPVLGPTLGGYLTDAFSWRWAFFINVPVGILAYLGILEGLDAGHTDHSRPFDWLGFILLSLAIGLLQMMLDRGHSLDWFSSPEILAEAFFGALCAYMFVVHAFTTKHPFVDPHLFRDRNFAVSLGLMFVSGMSIVMPSVLVPTFLQSLQGYSPMQAGSLQASRGVASIIAVVVAGRLVGRVGARPVILAGVIASGISLIMLAQYTLDTPRMTILLTTIFTGIASPLIFVPLSVVGYLTLAPQQRAEAGVMMTLIRNMGSSIGISVAVTTLSRSTQLNTSYLAEHFSAYDFSRWHALGTAPGANLTTTAIVGEIQRQAAVIAYSNVYYTLALASLVVLPTVFVMRSRVKLGPTPTEVTDLASH